MLPTDMRSMQNDTVSSSFQDLQYAFTRHIRDPENIPAPDGIEQRRVAVYVDLIYRNIEGFIANSFPVLRKITADAVWHRMLRDYIHRHISHTPYFPKMPLEFLHYLEHERHCDTDPGFYFELAHYEWIESSLMLDRRALAFAGVDENGDLLAGIPRFSPLAMPLAYQWPVHRIGPDYLPQNKPEQPTYLLVYRDRHYAMGFIELNTVAAKLVEALSSNRKKTGKAMLADIAKRLQHPDPDNVIQGGLEIMNDFKSKDILLGTAR